MHISFQTMALLSLSVIFGFVSVLPNAAPAQGNPCPSFRPIVGSVGYALRENDKRCEGLYESPVQGLSLEIVSVLKGRLGFDFEHHRALDVSAPNLPASASPLLHVGAVALSLKTYYRMDAVFQSGESMTWPIDDVLKPVGLTADNLGVFGWIESQAEKVFVPLKVVPKSELAKRESEASVELIVRSAVNLEKVVWRASSDYSSEPTPSNWQDATSRTVYAGQAIRLALPRGDSGILRVEIAGKRLNTDLWDRLTFRIFRP
jgi:hypothetical protein